MPFVNQKPYGRRSHWKIRMFAYLFTFIIASAIIWNGIGYLARAIYHSATEVRPIHRTMQEDEMIPFLIKDVPDKQRESVILGRDRTLAWLRNHDLVSTNLLFSSQK